MTLASLVYLTDHGQAVTFSHQPGDSPGSVGGFDVQRSGENWFCAINNGVARGTALNGAGTLWYSITGGSAQAVEIIVPYYTYAGLLNVSNTHPDVILGLSAPDGSSRVLLWVEGGSTPGTVHDLALPAGVFFKPNSLTIQFNTHIAVLVNVSGTPHLYTTSDRITWVDRGTPSSPTFIRTRRQDNRGKVSGTNKGQLYLAENGAGYVDYTSKWAAGGGPRSGLWLRKIPFAAKGLDTVW